MFEWLQTCVDGLISEISIFVWTECNNYGTPSLAEAADRKADIESRWYCDIHDSSSAQ